MSRPTLAQIESQLDELITRYHQLKQEYRTLSQQRQEWERERSRLLEKNELACARIEAMVKRLKSIETETSQ